MKSPFKFLKTRGKKHFRRKNRSADVMNFLGGDVSGETDLLTSERIRRTTTNEQQHTLLIRLI